MAAILVIKVPLKRGVLDVVKRKVIRAALTNHGGNVTYAAKMLGTHRQSLQRTIKRLKLKRRRR